MASPGYISALPANQVEGDNTDANLPAQGSVVIIEDGDGARTSVNPKTGVACVEQPDGSVVIYPRGLPKAQDDVDLDDWYRNLADEIDEYELGNIIEDLIEGIEADQQSCRQHLQDIADGISMLGFKLETPSNSANQGSDGISRVYHPLIAEACLRGQANARAELLPAAGPAKVEDAGQDQGSGGDDLAQELEDGMNYFLTVTATEYYPDTTRMLFDTCFGGAQFKKVYSCPLRERPSSEWVHASHLVVSNSATDLRNCDRVTHIIDDMPPSTLRRMQILGVYRDVPLGESYSTTDNPVDLAKQDVTGISPLSQRPKDKPHTLYEVRAKLDIPGFEDRKGKNGKATGLLLPWKITIDKDSRQCLEVRRDWKQNDKRKAPRRTFVKYPYVDALGFYGIGLFHILGNIARALTAAWRLALDNGMLANFPGGFIDKMAARQLTDDQKIPFGGFLKLDLGAKSMNEVIGPAPFRDLSPAFAALIEAISEAGSRLGGTAELPVGEGKQDAPVGTTIALLEQSTKITDAVHKGMHTAQAEELQIFKELFKEDPEAFWRHREDETDTWNKEKLLTALSRCDIVPVSDPNTPTKMHRIMKSVSLVQMAQMAPTIIDPRKTAEEGIRSLGYGDPDAFLLPPIAPGQQQDPKSEAALLGAHADMQDAQTKAKQLEFQIKNASTNDTNRDKDRQSKEKIAELNMKKEAVIHASRLQADLHKHASQLQANQQQAAADRAAQMQMAREKAGHAAAVHGTGLISDHMLQGNQHMHEAVQKALDIAHQQQMPGITQAVQPPGDTE